MKQFRLKKDLLVGTKLRMPDDFDGDPDIFEPISQDNTEKIEKLMFRTKFEYENDREYAKEIHQKLNDAIDVVNALTQRVAELEKRGEK